MRVVVVGAGLAGLTCAWTLHRRGVDVVVVEARERVGGRTWSHRFLDGTTVERGGEFIDADQHEIRRLCAELELPLLPHGVPFWRRADVGGARPTVEDVRATVQLLRSTLDARLAAGRGDCSTRALLAEALGDEATRDPVCLRLLTSTAADPAESSASLSIGRLRDDWIDAGARVLGGNQQIALAIAQRLGDRVHRGVAVRRVADRGTEAAVVLADGGTVEGDVVVVTVPLPLVATLEWAPAFPAAWRPGLDQLGFGRAAKLSAPLRRAAAARGVQAPGTTWWSWSSLDQHGEAGTPAVTAFAGTPQTVTDVTSGAWADELVRHRPDLDVDVDQAIVTDWAEEPFTRGAYSFGRVGWDERAATDLRTSQGRLVLAGEHTAGRLASTMNGAVVSGLRAAATLLPGGG